MPREFSSQISLRQVKDAQENGNSNQRSVHAGDGGWPVFRRHSGDGNPLDVIANAGNASTQESRNQLKQDQREE